MTLCLEAFDQAMGRANGVAFVEVVRAEILVGSGPVEHVLAGGKDRIGDEDEMITNDRNNTDTGLDRKFAPWWGSCS
jgi:hypothetical protein